MTFAEQRRERRPLWGSLLARVHQPVSHDARFQVARISLSTCLSWTRLATLAIRASC